jgi:hypothetical protein
MAWWRAWALRGIAEEMAKAGEVEGAVSIVEREMAVRTEGLPSVLEVLAGRASEGDGRARRFPEVASLVRLVVGVRLQSLWVAGLVVS